MRINSHTAKFVEIVVWPFLFACFETHGDSPP